MVDVELMYDRTKRRSAADVPPWIGWEKLDGYFQQCPTEAHRNLFATLFETGGRITEVLRLRPDQFRWNDDAVVIDRMLVFKQRRRTTRNVVIRRDRLNPLADRLVNFAENTTTKYLFPRHEQFTGKVVPDMYACRSTAYLMVRAIDDDLWPHWFRSMRSSYLVYVRGFNVWELTEWFQWKSMDTAASYVRGVTLAKKLGIPKLPAHERTIDEELDELGRQYLGGDTAG